MTDFVLPPPVPNTCEWTLHDYTGVSTSVVSGAMRTVSRGQRWGVRLTWHDVAGASRAALEAFVAAMRGKSNRVWISDPAYVQRGSFPSSELLANSAFASTANWSGGVSYTLTASGNVLRGTRAQSTGANSYIAYPDNIPTTFAAPGIPYMCRYLTKPGPVTPPGGLSIYDRVLGSRVIATGLTSSLGQQPIGMGLGAWVPPPASANIQPALLDDTTNQGGIAPGNYLEIPYATVRRCALIDAGANVLTYSDDISNAVWTKSQTTVVTNQFTAPDGTVTGDDIFETAVTNSHSVYQQVTKPAVAQDWCIAGALIKGGGANARNFAYLYLTDLGTNAATISFNLTTGAIVASASPSGTITAARGGSFNLGNGWFYCWLIANIPASITTFYSRVLLSTDGTAVSYAGLTNADIGVWRVTTAQSSVPVKLTGTVASAVPNGTTPTGTGVYVKGLPLSTSGLLLAGDQFDVAGEFKRATADLNSDGAGCGFLQFEPALRSAGFIDNSPIILGEPMGRFIMMTEATQPRRPGGFADFDLEFIEAA